MGSGRLLMPSSNGAETIYMAELREAHLRYLPAIYELGKSNPDVGIQAVAKKPNFDWTEEETAALVQAIVLNLPEHRRMQLAR